MTDPNELATNVLAGNRRQGESRTPPARYDYTCPSPHTYPFQWNWDSAFHAIALSKRDPARARAEVESLLVAAQPSGFLPHMVLWQEDVRGRAAADWPIAIDPAGWHTLTANPPVLPLAVERLAPTAPAGWLDRIVPQLVDVLAWWRTHRDPDGTGLVRTFQPDESGLDMSPKYDVLLGIDRRDPASIVPRWHAAVRDLIGAYAEQRAERGADVDLTAPGRFSWQDVLVNSIYGSSARALARLLRGRGADAAAGEWEQAAAQTTAALIAHSWDETAGAFFDSYLGRDGRWQRAEVLTASSLFPLVLEDLPSEHAVRLVTHLTDESEFWLPYPVPSVAASEPSFDETFATGAIFRGSSWVNLNWYLHLGLRLHGYPDVAAELARRTRAMVAQSGLRECYGPRDAAGHGARDFSWSALVLDLAG
jgi:hypothetical protein